MSLDWIILILVGCFVILAIASVIYPKHFEEFIKLPVSNKYFLVKGKTEEIKHPFTILLFIFQILSISLFIYLFFLEEAKISSSLFLRIGTGVFIFIILKLIIEKMIGTIFSLEEIINHYVYQKLTYRNFLSLLVFAANLLFYFIITPNSFALLVFTGCLVLLYSIVMFYYYKSYRSLLYGNFFYFILYLCTLEISPYVILYKTLV